MGLEIERKFLVTDESFRHRAVRTERIRQGYLSVRPESTVRVRMLDERAYLTVKGLTHGCTRHEYEYEIPATDAEEMLRMCVGRVIDKTRHLVPHGGLMWEVDEFHGAHAGLIVAEVELDSPDREVELPEWAGREVTGDARYYNSALTAAQ